MARVIRTRKHQPTGSPGVFVAALILIWLLHMEWLRWWTLLLVLLVPPLVNWVLVGRTTKEEIVIEKDL